MKKTKKKKKQKKTTEGKSYEQRVSERDLATIELLTKDSPETTSSTKLAYAREIGLTTRVIQLKQLTTVSLVSLQLLQLMTMMTTQTQLQKQADKQKINKSTTNKFSDDKCNNKYRTSE